jgi:hypothetical protein
MISLRHARLPSADEARVFEVFAAEAEALGTALLRGKRLILSSGTSVELSDAAQVELTLLSIRMTAREQLRRRDDLLALVDRVDATIAPTHRTGGLAYEVGIHVVRSIAMAELLQEEATARFPDHRALRERSEDALKCLATGVAARFGTRLPTELWRKFPRFTKAVNRVVRETIHPQDPDPPPHMRA